MSLLPQNEILSKLGQRKPCLFSFLFFLLRPFIWRPGEVTSGWHCGASVDWRSLGCRWRPGWSCLELKLHGWGLGRRMNYGARSSWHGWAPCCTVGLLSRTVEHTSYSSLPRFCCCLVTSEDTEQFLSTIAIILLQEALFSSFIPGALKT